MPINARLMKNMPCPGHVCHVTDDGVKITLIIKAELPEEPSQPDPEVLHVRGYGLALLCKYSLDHPSPHHVPSSGSAGASTKPGLSAATRPSSAPSAFTLPRTASPEEQLPEFIDGPVDLDENIPTPVPQRHARGKVE